MATSYKVESKQPRTSNAASFVMGFLLLMPFTGAAIAQSIDRDNPTPLAANDIKGSGIGKKVEYFYTFLAGPGEVILTVDSGAKGSFSQLEAQLFDLDAEKLGQVQNLPYPGETSRKVTRVSFGAQQPVLLRVFLDRDAAQYLVRLGGAIQLAGVDSSFSGSNVAPTDPGAIATTETAPIPPTTETVPPVTPATEVAGAVTTAPVKISGLKKFWLKLSSAGEVLGAAGMGSLHIEMKDGTAQDIAFGKITKLTVGQSTQAPADGSNITPSGEDKLSGWQRLWLKLGSAGDLTGLSGRPLRLEMKDGSVQELNPSTVKKISFKK